MKPSLIHLLDNAVSPALMASLADGPAGAPWYGFARIGKELLDIEFCRALKRSGCRMLKLGLESGDPDIINVKARSVSRAAKRGAQSESQAEITHRKTRLEENPPRLPARADNTTNLAIDPLPGYPAINTRLDTGKS
jgi:hypothetical protein